MFNHWFISAALKDFLVFLLMLCLFLANQINEVNVFLIKVRSWKSVPGFQILFCVATKRSNTICHPWSYLILLLLTSSRGLQAMFILQRSRGKRDASFSSQCQQVASADSYDAHTFSFPVSFILKTSSWMHCRKINFPFQNEIPTFLKYRFVGTVLEKMSLGPFSDAPPPQNYKTLDIDSQFWQF